MKKFWKKILVLVKKIDRNTRLYETSSKIPSLPSEAFVNRGLFLANKGEYEKAKEEFERAISVANPSPDAYINMGIYYARNGKFEDAMYYFRQAIKIDRYNARAYSLWASALVETNEIELAEKFYMEANRLNPRDSDIYFNWGVALARLKKREDAYEKLKRACFYNPLSFNAFFFWGVLLTEDGKYSDAIQKFNIVLAYAPNHKEVYHYLAYCNTQLGNLKVAKTYSDMSLLRKNDWAEGYILAAEIDCKLNCGEELLNYYELALKNNVESIPLYMSWILMLIYFKKYEEAIEKCLFILHLNPLSQDALYNLAFCYFNLQKYDEAMKTAVKMREFYPDNLNLQVLQGKIYSKIGEFQNAIDCYKNVVESSNKFYPLYCDIANAYNDMGDKQSAIKYYEKAIEYVPNLVQSYVNCARTLCELGEVKNALRKIRKAYSLDKENSFVLFTYAAVLMYDEKFEEALSKFRIVVEKGDLKEAKLGVVESLMNLNRLEEAVIELENSKFDFENSISFLKLSFEVYYKLAQNTNSAYNIEQALMWCQRVEELCGDDIDILDKRIKLREMSKQEQ